MHISPLPPGPARSAYFPGKEGEGTDNLITIDKHVLKCRLYPCPEAYSVLGKVLFSVCLDASTYTGSNSSLGFYSQIALQDEK